MSIDSILKKPPVALIIGPTASGKSALALALAEKQPSVVINADSTQVYRDLAILSARPSETEMGDVPHRLYGYIDGADACSAARWAADAKREIAAAQSDGRWPILVGGTGLYVRTLLEGIAPIPEIETQVREAVRSLPVAEAYARLEKADPISAAKLNPADSSRIARALEVVLSTGTTLPEWQQGKSWGIADLIDLRPLVLLPPREWLYGRCDARVEQMIAMGAIEEVEKLMARNLRPDCPVMRAIGVPEIGALLTGEMTEAEAIAGIQTATRQYAKRQYTWFRNQCPDDWPRHTEIIKNDFLNEIETLFHD